MELTPAPPARASSAPDRHYKVLIDHSPDAIVVHEGRRLVFANPAALRLVGATSAEQVEGHLFSEFVHQDSLVALRDRIATLDSEGAASVPTEMVLRRIGGRQVAVEARSVLTVWDGRTAYLAVLRDLSSQKAAEHAVASAERLFTSVVSTLAEAVVVQDPDGVIVTVNAAAERMLRIGAAEMIGGTTLRDLPPRVSVYDSDGCRLGFDDLPHTTTLRTGEPTAFVLRVNVGGSRDVWVKGTSSLIEPHPLSQVVTSFADVTAEHEARVRLAYQATHDSLTGLPNRLHIVEALTEGLRSPQRRPMTVLFIDLDNLKTINDSLGHSVGDDVLRVVSDRLRSVVPARGQVGRVGGDEFVALLTDELDDGSAVSDAVHSALAEPIELDGWTLGVGASIGCVVVPVGDQRTIDNLLRDADIAMYSAKDAGGNRTVWYSPELRR